ncbi:MAG: DUF4178 domain-containing protein [Planctomycetota bacterium]
MTTANCPTCGGPIEFKIGSSYLVVCPYCKSAVARTDRDLKSLGTVAELVETDSPLAIGLAGKFNGTSFQLTGRAQLRHAMGGVWDEWYAAFSDGQWGWLAEAQGRFYISFEKPKQTLPDFSKLIIGQSVPMLTPPFVVSEKGTANYAGAQGEIPYALVPESQLIYADLSGDNGAFATIDYTDFEPVMYSGREVTLNELALDAGAAQLPTAKKTPITNLGCPNCGGALNLLAPDATERVGCPSCGSLIDCTQGKFTLLKALKTVGEKPLIPLGSEAEFEGTKQIVIGFMKRSCIVEGVKYFWAEYLLYSKSLSFRWLVQSDNHWSYVKALQTSQVREKGKIAYYYGKSFKRFQDAQAVVESVLGEFYWKVTVGEKVFASDFVCAPQMISSERTNFGKEGGEIAWSLGQYITPEEIETKFKLKALKRPTTVGSCQPNPHQGWGLRWLAGLAAVIALLIVFLSISPDRTIFDQDVKLEMVVPEKPVVTLVPGIQDIPTTPTPAPPAESTAEAGAVWLSEPFELTGKQKFALSVKTTLNNAWIAVDGALIDETNGQVQPFDVNVEYWSGTDEDGSWSEGSQDGYIYLPAQPPGKYVLRLEGHWEHMNQPQTVHIKAEQTSIDPVFLFLALFCVSLIPGIMLITKFMFESNRWSESMYGSSSSGSDD